MATNFKRKLSQSIGQTPQDIGGYVVAAGTQVTVIGCTVSNVTNSPVQVTVTLRSGTTNTHFVKNMDVVPGQGQIIIGGDQKVVLEEGDAISVVSNTPGSVDAILSILELTA